MSKLTHFDGEGRAVMVDVGSKAVTTRRAVASGFVSMRAETLTLVTQNAAKKGDVISVAELAAVMGAKQTAALIPLCHPLPLSKVSVKILRQVRDLTFGLKRKRAARQGLKWRR